MQTKRIPYDIYEDRMCKPDAHFSCMRLRSFMAFVGAHIVSSEKMIADDSTIRLANDCVAAGIVFG